MSVRDVEVLAVSVLVVLTDDISLLVVTGEMSVLVVTGDVLSLEEGDIFIRNSGLMLATKGFPCGI